MRFREFFSKCEFNLIERGDSNWDYYTMRHMDEPVSVVALAKDGSGADDCFFGDMQYFKKWKAFRGGSVMTINDIIKSDYLTLGQVKTIPALTEQWFSFDHDYTFDDYLDDEIKMFARYYADANSPCVIKIESLKWVGNWQGRKNDYESDITVWVTAIVDCGRDKIVRLSFDLLDCTMMTEESGCSGSVHEPY